MYKNQTNDNCADSIYDIKRVITALKFTFFSTVEEYSIWKNNETQVLFLFLIVQIEYMNIKDKIFEEIEEHDDTNYSVQLRRYFPMNSKCVNIECPFK